MNDEILINIFDSILDQQGQNMQEITDKFEEIIKNPESIEYFFHFFNSEKDNYVKLSIIFFSQCISFCKTNNLLTSEQSQQIFEQLIPFFLSLNNKDSEILFDSIVNLSRMFESQEIVMNLIQQTFESGDNYHCLLFCTLECVEIGPNIDLLCSIFQQNIQTEDFNILVQTLTLVSLILKDAPLIPEIDEEHYNFIIEQLTNSFIHALELKKEDFIKCYCIMIENGFFYQYKTIPLEPILPHMQEVLNGSFPPRIVYYIFNILFFLFSIYYDIEMSENDIISFLDLSIQASLNIYDPSLTYEEQLANGSSEFILCLLRKLDETNSKEYLMQRISELVESSEEASFFISIMLMSDGIERNKHFMSGSYNEIFEIIFALLDDGNEILKNSVINFLNEIFFRFVDPKELNEENFPFIDLLTRMIQIIRENGPPICFDIIFDIIETMNEVDPIFEDMLQFLMESVSENGVYLFQSFNIIASLIKKSKSHSERLFNELISILQTYFQSKSDDNLEPYIINCVYSLFKSQPEKSMEQMEFLLDTITTGLESNNELSYNNSAKLLISLAKHEPSILPEIYQTIIEIISQKPISNAYNRYKNKEITAEYFNLVVLPTYKIYNLILKMIPDIASDTDLINFLFEMIKTDLLESQNVELRKATYKLYMELAIKVPDHPNVIEFRDSIISFIIEHPQFDKILLYIARIVSNLGISYLNGTEGDIFQHIFDYTENQFDEITHKPELRMEYAYNGSRFISTILEKSEDQNKLDDLISNSLEYLNKYLTMEDPAFQVFALNIIKTIISIGKLPDELLQPVLEICLSSMKGVSLPVFLTILEKNPSLIESTQEGIIQYFLENHESLTRFDLENLMAIISFISCNNESLFSHPSLHQIMLEQFPIRHDLDCNPYCTHYLVALQNYLPQELLKLYLQAIARTYAKPLNILVKMNIPIDCTPPLIGFLIKNVQANGGEDFLLSLLDNNKILLQVLFYSISQFGQ